MPQSYAPEFKKKIVRLHAEEGRTYKSITAEYGVSKASISKWCSEFSRECQTKARENPDTPNEMELMKENLRLRKELEEAKKENLFLKKALESQPVLKGKLILHSDQGSQFTSKAFVEFCESVHVTQSMSEAGYPYDNAPMEGYFNTLKSELIYLCEYDAEEALYQARIA